VDVNRRAFAIIGSVFVVLFIIQGVIILTRSSVSHDVTHIRVHPIGTDVCTSSRICAEPPPAMRSYLVAFVVDEHGTDSRPTCTVGLKMSREPVSVGAVMVGAPGRAPGLWFGSADVEGPSSGLSSHGVKVECG
jgi:hypothetical protein